MKAAWTTSGIFQAITALAGFSPHYSSKYDLAVARHGLNETQVAAGLPDKHSAATTAQSASATEAHSSCEHSMRTLNANTQCTFTRRNASTAERDKPPLVKSPGPHCGLGISVCAGGTSAGPVAGKRLWRHRLLAHAIAEMAPRAPCVHPAGSCGSCMIRTPIRQACSSSVQGA